MGEKNCITLSRWKFLLPSIYACDRALYSKNRALCVLLPPHYYLSKEFMKFFTKHPTGAKHV